MPPKMTNHDRTKARLENEVSTLRRELSSLRTEQEQRRREHMDQAVLQASLEQKIHDLQAEVETLRFKRKMREIGGAESNTKLNQRLQKLEGHVTKQERYITFLEEQVNRTRIKYQQRMSNVHQSADQLEEKLKNVRDEMRNIKEQAGEVDELNKKVNCLNCKLERRDKVIAHYEAQHEDFKQVIADLVKQVERQAGGDVSAGKKTESTHPNTEGEVTDDVTSLESSLACDPTMTKEVFYFPSLASALKIRLDA